MDSLLDAVQKVTPINAKEGTSVPGNIENATEINQLKQNVLEDA